MNVFEYSKLIEAKGFEVHHYIDGEIISADIHFEHDEYGWDGDHSKCLEDELQSKLSDISDQFWFTYHGARNGLVRIHLNIEESNLSTEEWIKANEKGLIYDFYDTYEYQDVFTELQDYFNAFVAEKVNTHGPNKLPVNFLIMDDIAISDFY